MDKKLLVSLMMTTPVAVFAQQWVGAGDGNLVYTILPEVSSNYWQADGVSQAYTTDNAGNLVCGAQTGFLKHVANLEAQGAYTFKATGYGNAYVKINGDIQAKKFPAGHRFAGQYVSKADNSKVAASIADYDFIYDNITIPKGDTGKNVTIEVCPINKDLEFTIGEVTMTFYFNFATAKSEFTSQNNKIGFEIVTEADNRQVAKGLRAELGAAVDPASGTLRYAENQIVVYINAIDLNNGDKLVTAFNTYNLGNYNPTDFAKATDDISVAIRDLQTKAGLKDAQNKYQPATSYNARVVAENAAWANIKANEANLAALNAQITQLNSDLAGKQNVANTIPADASAALKEYCKLALAAELQAEKDAIATLQSNVNGKYVKDSEGNLPTTLITEGVAPNGSFVTTANKISTDIAAISYANAVADWNAYGTFLTDQSSLATQWDTLFGEINNDYRVTKYTINGVEYPAKNVYDDVTGEANNKLSEAYKQNTGYDIKDGKQEPSNYMNIIDARLNLPAVEAEMAERLAGMEAAKQYLVDIYNDQQAELGVTEPYASDSANGIITPLQADCTSYKEFTESTAFAKLKKADQDKLIGYVNAMQAAIDKLCEDTRDKYLEHNLHTDADPFLADLAAVNTEKQNYNNYLNNTLGTDVVALLTLSNDLRKHVETETAKVKNTALGVDYSSDLFAKFASSLDNIDTAIEKYYNTAKADRTQSAYDNITSSITDVEGACDNLVSGFTQALNNLATAQTNLNTFQGVVTNKLVFGVAPLTPGYVFVTVGAGQQYEKAFTKAAAETAIGDYQKKISGTNGYTEQLKDIATSTTMNEQEAYDKAVEVANTVNTSNIAVNIKTSQENFVKEATIWNSANVDAMIKDIDKYVTTAPYSGYPGMDKIKLGADDAFIKVGLAQIKTDYGTASGLIPGAGADVTALGNIDTTLKGLVDQCKVINGKINDVLANHAHDKALETKKDGLKSTFTQYQQGIANLTVNPAAQTYRGEVSELLNKLTEIAGRYDQTYKNVGLVADDPTSAYQGYVNELDGVNTSFNTLKTNLLNNHSAFTELSAKSDLLSQMINEDNGIFENFDDIKFTEDAKEELAKLTEKLGNLNDAVTDTFGAGGKALNEVDPDDAAGRTYKEVYAEQYKDIQDAVEALFEEWEGGYRDAVFAANQAWMTANGLSSDIVNGQYTSAVEYVNDYLYGVTEPLYYGMLATNKEFIANHNELQACFKDIEKYTEQLNFFLVKIAPLGGTPEQQKVLGVAGTNYGSYEYTFEGKKEVVTLASLQASAKALNDKIIACLTGVDQACLGEANKFWAENGQVAVDAWGEIETRLTNAGLTADEISSFYGTQLGSVEAIDTTHADDLAALGTITPATLDYADADQLKKKPAVHDYIMDMDGIALRIDGLVARANYDLLPEGDRDADAVAEYVDDKVYFAVNTLWDQKSADAEEELAKLKNDINQWKLDSQSYTDNKNTVDGAYNSLVGTANTKGLEGNWNDLEDDQHEGQLDSYLTSLENLLNNANAAYDDAKGRYEIFTANSEVINKVIKASNGAYATAVGNIQKLLEWSKYREDQLSVIEGLKNDLEAAKQNVETRALSETAPITVNTAEILINRVGVTSVNNAYQTVYNQEYAFATDYMMVLLRTAFNNVNLGYNQQEGGVTSDMQAELDVWDSQIKALEVELAGLTYKANNRDACMDALKACEAKISPLIVELQAKARELGVVADSKSNTLQADKNELNALYESVTAAIEAFETTVKNAKIAKETPILGGEMQSQDTYTKPVQEEYTGKAEAIQTELDGINGKIEPDGANVIQDKAKFVYDMQQLQTVDLATEENGWDEAYNGTSTKKGSYAKDYSDLHYSILKTTLETYWENVEYAKTEADGTLWKGELRSVIYDPTDYNEINNAINGYVNTANQKVPGWLSKWETKSKTFDITPADEIPSDLNTNIFKFVSKTLYNTAVLAQKHAKMQEDNLINKVENPGVNEQGWMQTFIDYKDIVLALQTAYGEINGIDLDPETCSILVYRFVNNHPVKTTPAQAIAAYDAIDEKIDEISKNLDEIYDKAEKENLIVKGDVKEDGKLNVLDVQELIDLVLDQVEYDHKNKEDNIRDVNDDEDINVGDVTALINLVMAGPDEIQPVPSKMIKYMRSNSGNNTYRVEEVVGENGCRRYAMLLTNETAFAAGQLDVVLPAHAKVAGVQLGDRANALDAYFQDNGNSTRIVFTALDQSMIEGNNGCVLFIDVEGNAEIEVENVIFSDAKGTAYDLSNSTSGVNSIYEGVKEGVKAIYNAAGQKLRGLTKGINIIRNADGTTTKKIGK